MLTEYRFRAVERVLRSFDLDRKPGYFKLRSYFRLLERAEQLPDYKARSVQDIADGLGRVRQGERIFLRHAKLRYQSNGEVLDKPFEVPLADQTDKIDVLVNPCEPYRNPRLGETRTLLADVLESISFGHGLEDITLIKIAGKSSIALWSFYVDPWDTYYSGGGGNGSGWQESWNRLKDAIGKLFPKPAPIPGRGLHAPTFSNFGVKHSI